VGTGNKFGTFSGVFLPSVLAILGAVMFYIAPQVVGGVGLVKALIIILIAHSVTISTAFSISAIATNINVKGGGLYYLISRSLGSEFGGSLGVMLYLAQTIASSFYAIAFARAVSSIFISMGFFVEEFYIALVSLVVFGAIVYVGAKFVVKIQYFILFAILISLASVFLGSNTGSVANSLFVVSGLPFWVAFAMFFPAVTGVDAGVGMSGELKDPRKSLVIGTFTAIFMTMLIYAGLAIKYAAAASPTELLSNPFVVEKIALFGPLVLVGILLATSSSALSSLMTAPRSMTAMVEDRVIPRWLGWLGKTIGKSNEPRVAIILCIAIGIGVIMIGSLEFVSQVVSMFFLSVYGWINGTAFLEKISQNPSYRPTFSTPAIISFYGMAASYAIMYLFNPLVMAVAILFQLLIFYGLYKTKKSMKIEGVWDGVSFQLLRVLLRYMERTEKSKKNWRPTILAFYGEEAYEGTISHVVHWIGSRRSFTKMYYLLKGDLDNHVKERKRIEESLSQYIKANKLEIFPRVILSSDFVETMMGLMQAETVGNLPLNTVLTTYDKRVHLGKLIHSMHALNKNIVILRNRVGFTSFKTVDVWWSSEKNGNFLILLAYFIVNSNPWLENDAVIRIFKVVEKKEDVDKEREQLEKMLEESRIENVEITILHGSESHVKHLIGQNSQHSDLVMLGMPNEILKNPSKGSDQIIEAYTDKCNVSLIVSAHDEIDFRVN